MKALGQRYFQSSRGFVSLILHEWRETQNRPKGAVLQRMSESDMDLNGLRKRDVGPPCTERKPGGRQQLARAALRAQGLAGGSIGLGVPDTCISFLCLSVCAGSAPASLPCEAGRSEDKTHSQLNSRHCVHTYTAVLVVKI